MKHQVVNPPFTKWFSNTWLWIKNDFNSWPVRFILEVTAWAMSIGCSLTMALTVPNPPFFILYPLWIVGCAIYGWAAWTRGSFGLIANYVILVLIDSVGLYKLLINT